MDKIWWLKEWLRKGSINLFGMPFAGKDTVGRQLAQILDAEFLSSGAILRDYELKNPGSDLTTAGRWTPTESFKRIVLPHLGDEAYEFKPLILGGIGRWDGEEQDVEETLQEAGHPLEVVVLLNLSEQEIRNRWEVAQVGGDQIETATLGVQGGLNAAAAELKREVRVDDEEWRKVESRISEFRDKTWPIIEYYRAMGMLVTINGHQTREKVLLETVNKLYDFAVYHPHEY
ncbi:MAG: nucleoside monophosphate kinase [Candidatus Nomurabacteria bacterium]|jgi:adenylate kinase|nr:nucleoside monophosphate kinase [Candidatus Nomurabacteria bacterium]